MSIVFFKILLFCLFVLASYSAILVTHLWFWRRRCAPRSKITICGGTPLFRQPPPTKPGPYCPWSVVAHRVIHRIEPKPLPATPPRTLDNRVADLVAEFMRHIGGMSTMQFRARYEEIIQKWRDKGCPAGPYH